MEGSQEILSYEEFEERFWNYISKGLVSNLDIDNNRDWADTMVHDSWRIHRYSGIPYSIVMKHVEYMLTGLKVYKPMISILN